MWYVFSHTSVIWMEIIFDRDEVWKEIIFVLKLKCIIVDVALNCIKQYDWFSFEFLWMFLSVYCYYDHNIYHHKLLMLASSITLLCYIIARLKFSKNAKTCLIFDLAWPGISISLYNTHKSKNTYNPINQDQAPWCKPLISGFRDINKYKLHGSYLKIQKQ